MTIGRVYCASSRKAFPDPPALIMRTRMVAFSVLLAVLALLVWAVAARMNRDDEEVVVSTRPSAGDALTYLIEASERFAPDDIQGTREMEEWLDRLGPDDLAALARVYERADAAGHIAAAARELQA